MIITLNKGIKSYYAKPHIFTNKDPEQKVSDKLGKHLLKTGYFIEVKVEKESEAETKKEPEIEKESTKKKTK